MSENIDLNDANQSDQENISDEGLETIPSEQSEIIVPVKFNKQVLNLDLQKVSELAQKGMKFDVISKDYDELKGLAKAEGKSVGEFIQALKSQKNAIRENEILEKCGGDRQFAEHILQLENGTKAESNGLSELLENFPKIKSLEDLPESVVESAQLKGTLLLDEYLRYLHRQQLAARQSVKSQLKAEQSAMGSLLNKRGAQNPETTEFLRGLWQK
ncbi:MAG: hypothetical protein IKT44_03090 [Clostridia bacterium]|nr:hypothetical protein [Clostridia bacterium]